MGPNVERQASVGNSKKLNRVVDEAGDRTQGKQQPCTGHADSPEGWGSGWENGKAQVEALETGHIAEWGREVARGACPEFRAGATRCLQGPATATSGPQLPWTAPGCPAHWPPPAACE